MKMKSKKYIHEIKNETKSSSVFIILCARKSNNRGFKNIPLTSINSTEKLIDHQIKTIKKAHSNSEIIIVSGFEHERVIDYIYAKKYDNIRIAENKNYRNSTTLDGWRFALNLSVKSNTYIIHGDRMFTESCIIDSKNSYTLFHCVDKNNYNLGLLYTDNRLVNMSYGLENVWSEIFFISANDFDKARSLINNRQKKIHNIEGFINELSEQIDISIIKKQQIDIRTLKEI